jgi:hypothetical protein
VLIIFFFYPETANRSLEDIDQFIVENLCLFVNSSAESTSAKRPDRFAELERDMSSSTKTISRSKAQACHMEIVEEFKPAV